jgi:hypothetical protein
MKVKLPDHQKPNTVYRMYHWGDVIEWREEGIHIVCEYDTNEHSSYYHKWLVKAEHWVRFCDEENPPLDARRFGKKLLKVFQKEATAKAYSEEQLQLPINQQLGKWGKSHLSTTGSADPLAFEELIYFEEV